MKVYAKGVKEAIQKMKVEPVDETSHSHVSKDNNFSEIVISSSGVDPLVSAEVEIQDIPCHSNENPTTYISTAGSHDYPTTQEHQSDFSNHRDDLSHILENLAEEHEEIGVEPGENSSVLYSGLLSAHNSISGAWKAHSIPTMLPHQLKPPIHNYHHHHVQIPYLPNPSFSQPSSSFFPLTLPQEQQQQQAYYYAAPPTAMSLQQAIELSQDLLSQGRSRPILINPCSSATRYQDNQSLFHKEPFGQGEIDSSIVGPYKRLKTDSF